MKWQDKLIKRIERSTQNVEQTKLDVMNWATHSDPEQKKKFNIWYYLLFGSIFAMGFYWDMQSLKIMGGLILGSSLVGWIYANAKIYFQR